MTRNRTWAGLRPAGPAPAPEGRTIEDDYRDLFTSPMGQRVLEDMLEEAFGPSPEGVDERALSQKEGARKFVARLRARVSRDGQRRNQD